MLSAVGAGGGSELVLGVSVGGVNLAVEAGEQLGEPGLVDGQLLDGLGHDVADDELAAVVSVNGVDGVEEGLHAHVVAGGDGDVIGGTLATRDLGEDEALGGESKSSKGGNGHGDLSAGQDVGSGADGQGKGIDGVDGGGQGDNGDSDDLVHFALFWECSTSKKTAREKGHVCRIKKAFSLGSFYVDIKKITQQFPLNS